MIEQRLLRIIQRSKDPGVELDALTDEFRGGRNVDDLVTLLNSENLQVVQIGLWIADEIVIDPKNGQALVARLHELLGHAVPAIRIGALKAIYSVLDFENPVSTAILGTMIRDPDQAVRSLAAIALERVAKDRKMEKKGPSNRKQVKGRRRGQA